jgi:predicted SAM-dependent methyltransferase
MATMNNPLKQLRNRILLTDPLKIVLGAGDVLHTLDWIPTNQEELDITRMEDFIFLFGDRKIDVVFAEHVWEHLSWYNADTANRNIFNYLKPGGTLRLAVPDGFHPSPAYIEHVRPGGTGPGADEHLELYNWRTLTDALHKQGFTVHLLEYWDEQGNFNYNPWTIEFGKVERSLRFDERNSDAYKPNYSSLIVDAVKPL